MTLAFPEWLLTIENLTADWTFDTYEGEEGDLADPVHLLDDGFRFSWTFKDGLTPNVREPSTFAFKFTCAAPDDIPRIRQGDQLVLRLQRPPGVVSRDGSGVLVGAGVDDAIDIVYQGFRARQVLAGYHLPTKRIHVAIAATDYMADLNSSVDLTYGGDAWLKYDQLKASYNTYGHPMGISAPIVSDLTTVSVYLRNYPTFGSDLGTVHIRYGGDASSPRELQILDAINKWTLGQRKDIYNGLAYDTEMGWDGLDVAVMVIPMVVGELDMYPFPQHYGSGEDKVLTSLLGNNRSGLFYMAVWGPVTTLDAFPYELGLIGGDLASVPAAGVDLHDNTDLLIIDAANVEAAPEWASSRENAVNEWRFLGMSVDQGLDNAVEEFTIRDEAAIVRNGPVSRTIETLLVANVYEGSGAAGLNGNMPSSGNIDNLIALQENFRDTMPTSGGDWSPTGLTLHPRSLTDEQWDAYCGRWHPTGRLQQSVAVVNIEDDQNLAGPGTPLFLTLTGCDIRLSKGHLFIEPRTRPIRLRFAGDVAATFADVQATYPTIALADIEAGFTFGTAQLTAA